MGVGGGVDDVTAGIPTPLKGRFWGLKFGSRFGPPSRGGGGNLGRADDQRNRSRSAARHFKVKVPRKQVLLYPGSWHSEWPSTATRCKYSVLPPGYPLYERECHKLRLFGTGKWVANSSLISTHKCHATSYCCQVTHISFYIQYNHCSI